MHNEEIGNNKEAIERAKTELLTDQTNVGEVTKDCGWLFTRLGALVGDEVEATLARALVTTFHLKDVTGKTRTHFLGTTLDSVVRVTANSTNEHAKNAEELTGFITEILPTSAEEILGANEELRASLEQLLSGIRGAASAITRLYSAQQALEQVAGVTGPSSIEARMPLPRGQEGPGVPTSLPTPGLIPGAINALTAMQQNL